MTIYSRNDGVVGWKSCRGPAAEWVEVHSTDAGMGADPDIHAALVPRLAAWSTAQGPSSSTFPESAAS